MSVSSVGFGGTVIRISFVNPVEGSPTGLHFNFVYINETEETLEEKNVESEKIDKELLEDSFEDTFQDEYSSHEIEVIKSKRVTILTLQ